MPMAFLIRVAFSIIRVQTKVNCALVVTRRGNDLGYASEEEEGESDDGDYIY
jgi:hypothetical protein